MRGRESLLGVVYYIILKGFEVEVVRAQLEKFTSHSKYFIILANGVIINNVYFELYLFDYDYLSVFI